MSDYVPLSVWYATPTKKLGWWIKGQREALAYRLAPWVEAAAKSTMEAEREMRRLRKDRSLERRRRRLFGERAVAAEETAARYRSALEQIAAQVYTEDGMPKPLKFSAQSVLAEVARDVLAGSDDRSDHDGGSHA